MARKINNSNLLPRIGSRKRRGFAVGYALLITVLSLTPKEAFEQVDFLADFADKVVHFVMYAGLAFACCWAWPQRFNRRLGPLAAISVVCLGYGIVLECLQGAIPVLQRTFSVGDILANTLGAVAGAGLWACVSAIRNPHP